MRKTTIAGHVLRCLMSLLLALGPFLGTMVVKPQPAKAVDLEACAEFVKDGVANTVGIAANAAEMVEATAKAAACVSAATQDPIQAVVIVLLTALAVAGEFSGSDACEQMVNTAIGKLIATAFQESGIDKVLDKVKAGTSDKIAQFIGGSANEAITEIIPPLAQWAGCGCAVAGLVGDISDLAKDILEKAKEIKEDAEKCSPELATVIEVFDDAVEFFSDGVDKVGEFLDDAYCATLGAVFSDDDCNKKPPVWVDCTNGNVLYGAGKGIVAVGNNTFYSENENAICQCPSFTTPLLEGSYLQCKCPIEGQTVQGNVCGCTGTDTVIAFPGYTPFCGKCPEGAIEQNGQCVSCGAAAVINYKSYVSEASKNEPWAVNHDKVCQDCGDRSLASADGKTCVACGDWQYKDTATNTCKYCDWYDKGEILSTDGKTCISDKSCGENQELKIGTSSGDGAAFAGAYCGCKDGYVAYSAQTQLTGVGFQDSTCVKQIACNAGQHPDYKTGVCVNNKDCGDKQVVATYVKDEIAGTSWLEHSCQSCPMDKPNYNKATNTCDPDPPATSETTTVNTADWCKGENEVWSIKDGRCVTCPPYAEKKGSACVVRELSVNETPKQPDGPPDFGNTAYNGPKCPGMYEDPRGSCCPYNAINFDGMCPVPPSGSRDTRTGCPVGYEPRGEFCVIATLPGREPPDIALRCPPGLVSQGGQCIVPVVWNEPGLHPCPGGLAQVGNWCAAALQPAPGRDAPSSCPDGYTASGTYCVGATLPSRTAPTSPCDGARLPGGACLGNAGIAAAAVAAGVAGVVAGRRAGRGLPPGPYSGTEALVKQDPSGGRGAGAPKSGVTGTPALVKGTDDKGAKSGPTLGGTTFTKKSGDDTTQPKKDGGPTVKGTVLKSKGGDDNVGTSKAKGRSGPKIEPRASTSIKRDTPAPKTVTATQKLNTPKLNTPKLNAPTPPRPTAPALKSAPPPALKLPSAPQLKMPSPGGASTRPLIK